jgi:hypothetical protein
MSNTISYPSGSLCALNDKRRMAFGQPHLETYNDMSVTLLRRNG